MAIKRFEDIKSCQEARVLAGEIYEITNGGDFARDYGLRDQIRRATVSILSNIAEGFEKDTPREFCRYLRIAKGSAGEVRAQLYVALDVGFLTETQFNLLYNRVSTISRLLHGLVRQQEAVIDSQQPPRPSKTL